MPKTLLVQEYGAFAEDDSATPMNLDSDISTSVLCRSVSEISRCLEYLVQRSPYGLDWFARREEANLFITWLKQAPRVLSILRQEMSSRLEPRPGYRRAWEDSKDWLSDTYRSSSLSYRSGKTPREHELDDVDEPRKRRVIPHGHPRTVSCEAQLSHAEKTSLNDIMDSLLAQRNVRGVRMTVTHSERHKFYNSIFNNWDTDLPVPQHETQESFLDRWDRM